MGYEPTVWKKGDTITAKKLNHLEEGVANATGGIGGLEYVGIVECYNTENNVSVTIDETGSDEDGWGWINLDGFELMKKGSKEHETIDPSKYVAEEYILFPYSIYFPGNTDIVMRGYQCYTISGQYDNRGINANFGIKAPPGTYTFEDWDYEIDAHLFKIK